MITLFKANETDFTHNGLGALDKNALDTIVEEELNGLYSFNFKYPIFAPHGSEIDGQSVIRVPTPDGDQLFRVYNPIKSMGYLTVKTYHIFYDLADNFIEDTNIVGKNGQGAIAQLGGATQYGHSFRFFSDIETITNARMVRMNPVAALIDDEEDNAFISRWGGELKRNNFDVRMNKSIGSNRGKKIRHRKDLVGYEANVNWSTATTRIMPKGFDGLLLPEKYVDSPLINHYVHPKIKVVEYSGIKAAVGEYADDEGAVPLQTAYQLLREAAAEEYSINKADVPEATYKVDFVNLDKTKEYRDLQELQQVFLGDTVTVIHEEDGLNIEAKVISYKYDPIAKKYLGLELGSFKDVFSSTYSDVNKLTRKATELTQTINYIQSTADGKNTINRGLEEPLNPNINDLWYKPNGAETELWQYVDESGIIYWKMISSTAELNAVKKEVEQHTDEIATVAQSANDAVTKADQLIIDAGFISLDTAKIKSDALTTASTAQSAYNNAVSALSKADTAISTTESFSLLVNDLEQSVTFKADSSRVDTISGKVDSQGVMIQANADALIYKADKTSVDTINQTVNQHTNDISINAQAIDARLTSTQVESAISAKNYVNSNTLAATASGLNVSIAKVSTELSDLEIGGRNLTLKSDVLTGSQSYLSGFLASRTVVEDSSASGKYVRFQTTASGTGFYISPFKKTTDMIGQVFTWSFYAKADAVKTGSVGHESGGQKSISLTTEWQKFTHTFVMNSNTYSAFTFYMHFIVGEVLYIRDFKSEKGNKATDWSPAPEDMTTLEQFTTLDATVSGIQTTVGNKADKSQVTQLANQWTQTTNLANGHTSQISSLGTEINLRVIKTDLISQINIQSNNILIQSGKLYLDAASVVFSGSAFIPSAAITTLTADKITAGTLNAANVNVINLNVSKLVGNTSDFVRSAWNAAAGGNVSIAGGGVVTTGSNGAQTLLQNGVLYTKTPGGSGLGTIGYALDSTEDLFSIDILRGNSFTIRYQNASGSTSYSDVIGYYDYLDRVTINKATQINGPLDMNNQVVSNVKSITTPKIDYMAGRATYVNGEYMTRTSYSGHQFYMNGSVAFVLSRNHSTNGNSASLYAGLNMQGYSITNQSDRRLKTEIVATANDSLLAISKWNFVDYRWIDSKQPSGVRFGLIAQDTPELVLYDAENDIYNMDSSKQTMMNSQAIQQLNQKVVSISHLATATNAIANSAMNKALQVDDEVQKMKNKISELEKEIKTLKGAA